MEAAAPRTLRRRLRPLAILAVLGGLAYLAISVDRSPPPPTGGRQLPKAAEYTLTAHDRSKIDHALDVFLRSAVERRDVSQSYDWVTPQLRGGKTRAQWTANHLPVMPYRSREQTARHWRLTYAKPREAGMELLLHPAPGSKLGPIAFTIRVKKLGGRWLVDTWYANAFFAKDGERSNIVAVPDLGPPPVPGRAAADNHPGSWWIGIPLLVVILPALIAMGVGAVALARTVRQRRRPLTAADERALMSWDTYRDQVRRDRERVE
jgi:hypothetical protein